MAQSCFKSEDNFLNRQLKKNKTLKWTDKNINMPQNKCSQKYNVQLTKIRLIKSLQAYCTAYKKTIYFYRLFKTNPESYFKISFAKHVRENERIS